MMLPLHPEWDALLADDPNVKHDDDQRNAHFYSSEAGHRFVTQVSTTETALPARDGYQIPIRIYTAKDTQTSHGVVVFFHSGGFVQGSLETEDISCRYMALGGPITIISIDYRLSPTHLYPIPINDGWDAFQYIVTNLSSLANVSNIGNDRVRLVVSGTSSGGHLAAIVSQRARNWLSASENATAAAMVTFSGVLLRAPVTVRATETDFIPPRFRDLHRSWSAEFESGIKRSTMEEDHDLFGVPLAERTTPDAYPLWGQFSGLPRTYIQICEVDIMRDDAVCYAQGLRDAEVEVHQSTYKGLPHIFWVYAQHLEVSKKAQKDCVHGLRWLLGITDIHQPDV